MQHISGQGKTWCRYFEAFWTIDVEGWLSKRGTFDLHTKSAFEILNKNHSENNHSNALPKGPKLNCTKPSGYQYFKDLTQFK